jgi:hypothetical protein
VGEESDPSPLTSFDKEEEEILHPIKGGRTLQPRVAGFSTLAMERSTSSHEIVSLLSPSSLVDQPSRASIKHSESFTAKTTFVMQEQRHEPGPYVSGDPIQDCAMQSSERQYEVGDRNGWAVSGSKSIRRIPPGYIKPEHTKVSSVP